MSLIASPRLRGVAGILAVAVYLVVTSGCSSVDHVTAYNQARTLYNEAIAEGNLEAFAPYRIPGDGRDDPVEARVGDLQSGAGKGTLEGRLASYRRIHGKLEKAHAELKKLNEKEASDLIADKLFASSVMLELLAAWQEAFYAHLIGLEAPSVSELSNASGDEAKLLLEETPSLIELRARSVQLERKLEDAEVTIHARDRFILNALDPLIRYDNAYVWALRYREQGKLATSVPLDPRRASVIEVVNAIADAEKRLKGVKFSDRIQDAGRYVAASRIGMIRTAIAIVVSAKVNRTAPVPDGTIWKFDDAKAAIPELYARQVALVGELEDPDADVAKVLAAWGFETVQARRIYIGSLYVGPDEP